MAWGINNSIKYAANSIYGINNIGISLFLRSERAYINQYYDYIN